ncbi:MAG: hypothetical protein IJ111_07145 [Eggerthellaceae bacterium]|nr:hypothetical protein [Eggerthellaceae bacterium]
MKLQDHFKSASWGDVWGWLESFLVEDIAQAPEVPNCSIGDVLDKLKARYERAFDEAQSLNLGEPHGVVWVGPSVDPGMYGLTAYVVDPSEKDPIDVGDLAWEQVLSCEVAGYCEVARASDEIAAVALEGLCRFGYSADDASRGRAAWVADLEEKLRESERQIAAGEFTEGDAAVGELRKKLGLKPRSPESIVASLFRGDEGLLVSLVRRREMAEALADIGWVGFSWPSDYEVAFGEAVERILSRETPNRERSKVNWRHFDAT